MFLTILRFHEISFWRVLMSNLHLTFEKNRVLTYKIWTSNSSKTEKKLIWKFQLFHFKLQGFKVTITDHMCFKCNLLEEFYFPSWQKSFNKWLKMSKKLQRETYEKERLLTQTKETEMSSKLTSNIINNTQHTTGTINYWLLLEFGPTCSWWYFIRPGCHGNQHWGWGINREI